MIVRLTQKRVTGFNDMNKQTAQCPSCIRSDRGENRILCHWSVRLEWREGNTNRGEWSWQQLLSIGEDVPRRGDVVVVLHSSRVWTKWGAGVQRLVYKKTPDFTSSPRLPTNTSTQPNTNRVGALISSHPGDEVTPVGPGRTSTVHGCLVRQEGCGWPVPPELTRKALRTPTW